MKNIIFLKSNQKKLLEGSNIGIRTLSYDKLRECLTQTDFWDIQDRSYGLIQPNQLLSLFGFTPGEDSESVVCSGDMDKLAEYSSKTYTTVLDAACPNDYTIIIWETEEVADNSNSMFRLSMYNILQALSTVLLYNQLKHTKQFEISIKKCL